MTALWYATSEAISLSDYFPKPYISIGAINVAWEHNYRSPKLLSERAIADTSELSPVVRNPGEYYKLRGLEGLPIRQL